MILALLTFLTGIAISVVAIYYSVLGLAAIFAAAVVPIVIMGTTLEIAKLVTAWWLKANWHRAPLTIKLYLLPAVVILMLITSMGIFGFLSKAHTDQAVPMGETVSRVAFIDEKISNERDTIANARTLIKQLDDAVIGIQSGQGREIRNRDGSTRIENPAERALQVRRAQAADRAALTKTIDEAQARIVNLQEEKAPIASQLRAVEAEVGPIKYIAKLIYGDNPDQNLLEKAVVWVIIIIVSVFDPLAVLLLLASQMSFQWYRKEQDEKNANSLQTQEELSEEEQSTELNNTTDTLPNSPIEAPMTEIVEEPVVPSVEPETTSPPEESASVVEEITEQTIDDEELITDDKIIEEALENEKSAMKAWKHDHPESNLKAQKLLLKKGLISKLPWDDYLGPVADFDDNEAAAEAARWAQEQIDASKKKDPVTWMERVEGQQIKRVKED